MTLVSLISYVDRNTLALLAPTILKDIHLTDRQYGFAISAFSIAYMLGNPVWGRLLDRFGLRLGMTVAFAVWTLASASHAFVWGLGALVAARAVLGFGEGATFPAALRTVTQTLPVERRLRGIAVAYSGGSLGAVITPILVTPIALRYGWRGAFWFTGLAGLAWLLWWLWMSRRAEIRQNPAPEPVVAAALAASSGASGIRVSDPRIWSFALLYAMGGAPLGFVLYGASLYLSQALGRTQSQIGWALWIPPLGWETGYFFWGWAIDRFAAHGDSLAGMRRLVSLLLLLGLPLAATARLNSVGPALFVMFLAMFVAGGQLMASMAYATRIYSSRNYGFLAGLGAGSWSLLVALTMPLFGGLFDHHRYQAAFLLAAAFPVAGSLLWQGLNWRRRSRAGATRGTDRGR
jgi:ACS family hexuronate transporter-like MFS transporter